MALHESLNEPASASPRMLRHTPAFRWLLGSDAAETLGDSLLRTLVPLLAVSVLGAGAMSVSLLNALGLAAFLVCSIPVGVWVERRRKKQVLIFSTLFRALLVISLPLAYLMDLLSLSFLLVVVGLLGIADVLFTTAHATLFPPVLGKDLVSLATARLHSVRSVVGLATPTVAGVLLKLFAVPFAFLPSVLSYLFSAWSIAKIREEPSHTLVPRRHPLREARQGFSYCLRNKYLRAMMLSALLMNCGAMFGNAASAVYALNHLGITPAGFALAGIASACGGLLGSVVAAPALQRFGLGRVKILSSVSAIGFLALFPLALHLPGPAVLWLLWTNFGWAALVVVHTVAGADVIPKLTDPSMLARVTATNRFFVLGFMPLASLLGGLVATVIGPVSALWGWVLCAALSVLPILCSPIRSWRKVPENIESTSTA